MNFVKIAFIFFAIFAALSIVSSNPCGCGGSHLEDNVAGPDPCGCGNSKQVVKRDVNVAGQGKVGGPPGPKQ